MKNQFIVLLLFTLFWSCDSENEAYPVKIDCKEYNMISPSYPRLDWDKVKEDIVVVVNNRDELEKFIFGNVNDEVINYVDLNKYTLLLAIGKTNSGILGLNKTLTRTSRHKYLLDVKITLYRMELERKWYIAVLVPKLPTSAVIDIDIEMQPIPDIDNLTACGVLRPHENLPWLVEIIAKAENAMEDGVIIKDIDYAGTVWVTLYKGKNIFLTNMVLNEFTPYIKTFDCDGNRGPFVDAEDVEDFYGNIHTYTVVYNNVSYY
jgi:hypothetical protein